MRYKKFGSTGKDISVLCLGTWALGGKQFGAVTQEDAVAAVHAMIDCGVNIVDTAPIYASGGSEEVLGKALQGGYRDKVFLITKFGSEFVDPNDSDKGTIKDSSRKNMLKSIDASLKRLQTAKKYPQYGFEKHKGYVTKAHKEALSKYGPCPIHRKSFKPVQEVMKEQISLNLDI